MMLGLYLERIVREKTKTHFDLITVEFPIAKPENRQSTNIDYAMIDKKRETLLLVELKTEKQKNSAHFRRQLKKYRELAEDRGDIKESWERILKARRIPSHRLKYEEQKNLIGSSLDKVKHVEIMYIAPDSVIDKELKSEDADFMDELHKIAFSELLEMDFDDDWNTIKEYIRELNTPLKKDRSKKG
jgi:hypothetical protein